MPDEIHELRERAEKGAEDRNLAVVTVTMAILAVLIASASLLGHRAHTEELLMQTQATDQWAYYQAKDIRRRSYEVLLDELTVFQLQDAKQGAALKDKYTKEVDRAAAQQKDIEDEATKAETEVKVNGRRADRFDLGEVLLEAALVITSITLLTRNRIFLHVGIILGICGVALSAAGFLIH